MKFESRYDFSLHENTFANDIRLVATILSVIWHNALYR